MLKATLLIIFLGSLIHAQPACAEALSSREVSDGHRNYTLTELINDTGEYEVHVVLHETRAIGPTSQRLVLIGRGIDVPAETLSPLLKAEANPHRVTTWFIPTSFEILKPIELIQLQEDPWPTAQSVIENNIGTENRSPFVLAFDAVAPLLSMAIAHNQGFFVQIKKDELELYDLEIRTNHTALLYPGDSLIPVAREKIAKGWTSVKERLVDEKTRKVWLWGAGDVALFVTATKLFSLAARAVGYVGAAISRTEVAGLLASKYTAALNGVSEQLARVLPKSKATTTTVKDGGAEVAGATAVHLTAEAEAKQMISYEVQRSKLGALVASKIKGGLKTVAESARDGLREIKYIALTQTMQVVGEVAARPKDLFDSDPIIMTKKIATDKEFLQDFAYMTNETFWMASVTRHYHSNFGKRVAICGAIGMVDSVAMSLVVKGETNLSRTALDSGWEVVIGNLQTQIDIASLRYFEGLAARQANPKLKLIGYVVALVDQTAGYFAYARATHTLEQYGKKETAPNTLTAPPQLKIIPVMGPT